MEDTEAKTEATSLEYVPLARTHVDQLAEEPTLDVEKTEEAIAPLIAEPLEPERPVESAQSATTSAPKQGLYAKFCSHVLRNTLLFIFLTPIVIGLLAIPVQLVAGADASQSLILVLSGIYGLLFYPALIHLGWRLYKNHKQKQKED